MTSSDFTLIPNGLPGVENRMEHLRRRGGGGIDHHRPEPHHIISTETHLMDVDYSTCEGHYSKGIRI